MSAVFAMALALQILPAPDSVRWEPLANDQGESVFIDPASVRRDGQTVRYLVRVDAHDSGPGNEIQRLIMRIVLDCGRGLQGIEAADGYDGAGALLASREAQPAEIEYEPLRRYGSPDSVRRRLCPEPGA